MKITIENICPDFLSFWEIARTLDPGEQKKLWKTLYEDRHRDIFDVYYSKWGNPNHLDSALSKYPDIIPGLKSQLCGIDERINHSIRGCARIFESQGIDFNFIIMIGVFTSNGWGTVFHGRITGFIALECFTEPRCFDILVSHEAAHCFHALCHPEENISSVSTGEALFLEGIATVASAIVCPDAPEIDYLWFGLDMKEWAVKCESMWPELRSLLLRDLDKADSETYRSYFLGDSFDKDIPVRSGYYAGFRLIRFLNMKYSIPEMTKWSRERALSEIKTALSNPLV